MTAESQTRIDPAAATLQYCWSFIDELATMGVSEACICPGSRSTPLALSLQRHPGIRIWRHVDERSAGYFAVGMAKALRRPVIALCTSGTAAANFFPSIVEAHYSRTSLLVLTADRPHKLRQTGGLQTIDQLKLYGDQVKWFVDMAPPQANEVQTRYVRSIAAQAIRTATLGPAGPVHLNFPFSEPFVPLNVHALNPAEPFRKRLMPISTNHIDRDDLWQVAAEVAESARGLIVAGPVNESGFAEAVTSLSEATGYPILADPLSQCRCGPHDRRSVIDNYDIFLRDRSVSDGLVPDVVLRFGMTPASKTLIRFLDDVDAHQIAVDEGGMAMDPGRRAVDVIPASPTEFANSLCSAIRGLAKPDASWTEEWVSLKDRTSLIVEAELTANSSMSEPRVFAELREILPSNAVLYVGNSMPVRDLDAFFRGRSQPLRFLGNRGVNGIDGVVSSALGAAATLQQRIVLVIGDLSFYHDINGLLASRMQPINATIILLNNDGGGIFHFLPQAHQEGLEELFVMPTGLDFGPIVAAYGGSIEIASSWPDFRSQVVESFGREGVSVVEVKTNRDANLSTHQGIWAAVSESLSGGNPD